MKPILECPRCNEQALAWHQKLLGSGFRLRPCRVCGYDFVFETPWRYRWIELLIILAAYFFQSSWIYWAIFAVFVGFDLYITLFKAKLALR